MTVKISPGNSKLGSIPSVSLPAGITCRTDCDCIKKCYAKKLERIRRSVREAYQHNYRVLKETPDIYWREVEASIMMSRFFRFHVSGDIPDEKYLDKMVHIAERNPHCEILCFTKQYDFVADRITRSLAANEIFGDGSFDKYEDVIPKNLHIILSGWDGLEMYNPYKLPEAHVRYKNGETTARDYAVECGGNCTKCLLTEGGCWTLKSGEQVVFNEH